MKLGLSLKLTAAISGGAVTADWAAWDGTNDGAVTLLQTAGGRGVSSVTCVSATKALVAYTKAASNTSDLQCLIATRDGLGITENGNVDITSGQQIRQKPTLCTLSETRALVAYVNDTPATDRCEIALIDTSGTTPVVLDTIQNLTYTAGTRQPELITMSETQAVIQEISRVFTVNVSSDVLSLGNTVTLASSRHGAITKMTSTSFAAASATIVRRYTISGTTITADAQITYSGVSITGDLEIVSVSETELVVFYEISGLDQPMNAVPLTWSGSWALGSVIEVEDDRIFTQDSRWSWALGDTRSIMLTYQKIDTSTEARYLIVTSDESHALTVDVNYVSPFTASVQADHTTGDIFPGTDNKYVIAIGQEETTTPVKQICAAILQG